MATVVRKVKTLYHWLKNQVVQLNLFDSDRSRSDIFHLRTTIVSTRIYISLLILIVIILVVCSALDDKTESITIRKPPQAIYEDLYNKYPTTLSCRCKQTAIPFGAFISVSSQYHPLCSSVFVSDTWISLLFNSNISYYLQTDFRSSASGQFQLLSSFCLLAKRTIRDALDDFLSSTLLTVSVVSPQSLTIQSEAQSMFVRTSSGDAIRRLVDVILNTTHINHLQPALQTTAMNFLYIYPDGQVAVGISDGCFTQTDGTQCCCSAYYCSSPSSFYDLYAYETYGIYVSPNLPIANVSGFMVGCYAIESLLQSTLECLFDQICVNNLFRFFPGNNITGIDVLRANQTKFLPKTLVGTLISELFIEQWSTVSSFSAYYNQCAPISCTYTFVRRNNILYILTTLIGLYGGLTFILRLCVPRVIHWYRNRVNRPTTTDTRVSPIERLQTAWRRMKVNIIRLNLYRIDGESADPYDLTTAIISTRIYLFFLGVSITTLIIFSGLKIQVDSVTIENPSQKTYEHLHTEYRTTFQCACSRTAISYGSFVFLSPEYHPICSSSYITPEWINSIVGTVNPNFVYSYEDFHVVGQTFFSTVAVLCSVAQSTFSGAWFIFNHSTLITDHVLSNRELIILTNSVLDQFQFNTINEFKRIFSLIRLHTKTMFSTKRSNADLYTKQFISDSIQKEERLDFHSVSTRYGNCVCALGDECQQNVAMYSNGNSDLYEWKFFIPNFFVGCFTIQSVLQSSLECFFDQACLNAVQAEIVSNRSINIPVLLVNATRFSPETLISTLVDSLMIEDWGRAIQYDQYYEQCAPRLCSYKVFSRANVLYILTKLIGLIGGLTVGLKIMVSIIVKRTRNFMRSVIDRNYARGHRMLKDRLRSAWNQFKTTVLQLNIFTQEVTLDEHLRYTGIIATRIYFLLITLSTIIIIIYTCMEKHIQHITIPKPSQAKFEYLQSNSPYLSTLECPCQNISIPYNAFISVTPHFHQLCSSDFVVMSSDWMSLIYSPMATLKYTYDDFRIFMVPEFQSLFALCTLANETLTDALTQFMSNTFASVHVQTRQTIEKHANESVFRFRSSTPRTFVRLLDYVRHIAQGNGIVSSISSNWHFLSLNTTASEYSLWSEPRSYNKGTCSCGINATCTSPAFINEWRVPGFLVGCYPLEALLQSTLECLYDAVCINKLKTLFYIMNITIRPLNPTLSTPNATVQSLINALLVDRWETSVIYERYYAACEPVSCSYFTNERANLLYNLSTIVGLYGGLSLVLELIIPVTVRIGQYFIMRRRRRVQPTVSVIERSE